MTIRAASSMLLLLLTIGVNGAERETFPGDFQRQPCAVSGFCEAIDLESLPAHAASYLSLRLDRDWMHRHAPAILAAFAKPCEKLASCYATANGREFCNKIINVELERTCDTMFAPGTEDRHQCHVFVGVWSVALEVQSKPAYEKTQSCKRESVASAPPAAAPEVWIEPAAIPIDSSGPITVYALDRATRLPLKARVTIESPEGSDAGPQRITYFSFPWSARLLRRPNREGHRDVIAPQLRVEADGYPAVSIPMPMAISQMVVTMTPARSKLKRGRNSVIVKAVDAATGKPVEARVMIGQEVAGQTNEPIELIIPRGKQPEIWVTSMFDRYSDVVVK